MKTLEEKIAEAVQAIAELDKENAALGRHDVNEDVYLMVQEYVTKDPENGLYEAHKKYVDVQYIIEGKENIFVTPVSTLKEEKAYSEEIEAAFYAQPERATQVMLTSGGYVVLYPEDAHMPGMKEGENSKVRKIVGKVRI